MIKTIDPRLSPSRPCRWSPGLTDELIDNGGPNNDCVPDRDRPNIDRTMT